MIFLEKDVYKKKKEKKHYFHDTERRRMRILINHIRYNIFQSDAIKVWKHIHKLFKSPQSQSLVGLLCNFFLK